MSLKNWFKKATQPPCVSKEEQDLALAIQASKEEAKRQAALQREAEARAERLRLLDEEEAMERRRIETLLDSSPPTPMISMSPIVHRPYVSSPSRTTHDLSSPSEALGLDEFVESLLRRRGDTTESPTPSPPIAPAQHAVLTSDDATEDGNQEDENGRDDDEWSLNFGSDEEQVGPAYQTPPRLNQKKRSMAAAVGSSKRARMYQPRPEQPRSLNYYDVTDGALEEELASDGYGGSTAGLTWETRGQSRYK
ncbi:hypothetical protein BC940DRAFT_290417 [Gongronella butleri]|nr:hypothetical protein BC940DRAFT_290417 [Gongronella butleri]